MSKLRPFIRLIGRRQRGVAAVEFALVALLIFFPLLIGTLEFGRWLFLLNGANEATRLGARLGVVCSIESGAEFKIRTRMSAMTGGGIPAANMVLDYDPPGCTVDTCRNVTARIVGAQFAPVTPYFGLPLPIPEFPTSLPREYMNSTGNPVCP